MPAAVDLSQKAMVVVAMATSRATFRIVTRQLMPRHPRAHVATPGPDRIPGGLGPPGPSPAGSRPSGYRTSPRAHVATPGPTGDKDAKFRL
jgi:hypothetical protein